MTEVLVVQLLSLSFYSAAVAVMDLVALVAAVMMAVDSVADAHLSSGSSFYSAVAAVMDSAVN